MLNSHTNCVGDLHEQDVYLRFTSTNFFNFLEKI